jgi:hypothetical protein
MSEDKLAYYARRAEAERANAAKAADPAVARLHAEMAARYDAIVSGKADAGLTMAREL